MDEKRKGVSHVIVLLTFVFDMSSDSCLLDLLKKSKSHPAKQASATQSAMRMGMKKSQFSGRRGDVGVYLVFF